MTRYATCVTRDWDRAEKYNIPESCPRTISKFSLRKVQMLRVHHILSKLKDSSFGVDQIPPKVLREAAESLAAPITYLNSQSVYRDRGIPISPKDISSSAAI